MTYFIINTAVANIYNEPSHSSGVVTQALMGESCQILENMDDWYRIRQWDGYEGWIYYFYGVESNIKYEPTLMLQDLFGIVTTAESDAINNIVFGNRLQAEQNGDYFKVTLPDGSKGISYNNFGNELELNRSNLIKVAKRFLGVPYLWGGKSPYGFDCSGLVQTVFKTFGIELPRDAHQQAEFFSKNIIDNAKIEHGDLLFFGDKNKITHVGISTGGLEFINARGFVQIESIDEQNTKFNSKLRDLFLHVASIKNVI